MNLISKTHNFYERKEYAFNVLPKYNVIIPSKDKSLAFPRVFFNYFFFPIFPFEMLHTDTHTHTYIYIYIYIYNETS